MIKITRSGMVAEALYCGGYFLSTQSISFFDSALNSNLVSRLLTSVWRCCVHMWWRYGQYSKLNAELRNKREITHIYYPPQCLESALQSKYACKGQKKHDSSREQTCTIPALKHRTGTAFNAGRWSSSLGWIDRENITSNSLLISFGNQKVGMAWFGFEYAR